MGILILERNEPEPLGRRAMKRVTCGSGGGALVAVPLGPLLSSLTAPHLPLSPPRPHSSLGLERKSGRRQAEDIRGRMIGFCSISESLRMVSTRGGNGRSS